MTTKAIATISCDLSEKEAWERTARRIKTDKGKPMKFSRWAREALNEKAKRK